MTRKEKIFLLGLSVGFIRCAVFWYLLFRQWSQTESLGTLPLIFLLLPEILATPQIESWSILGSLLFSLVLFIGSFVIATILVFLEKLLLDR